MIKAVLDGGREYVGKGLAVARFDPFVNHISTQRQGHASILLSPPGAQVLTNLQTLVLISQLPLVDDQTNVGSSVANCREDLVEGNNHVIQLLRGFAQPKLQRQERTGHSSWHGDFIASDF